MPGFTGGIRLDIEIENEAANPAYWHYGEADRTVAADTYLRLLELSYQAKQGADPDTQVILCGLIHPNLLARCDGNPGCGYGAYFHENVAFTKRLLDRPDLFDAVDCQLALQVHDSGIVDQHVQWLLLREKRGAEPADLCL